MVIRHALATALACALAAIGCSTEEAALTEIMLVVDSDLPIPDELDEIRMTVTGPTGKAKPASARLGKGEPALPRSLALVHETGPLKPVKVLVEGLLKSKTVLKREAQLEFLKGQTLVLPMHLVQACVDEACASGQTCTENGCQSSMIDAESLGSWTGTKPRLGSGGDLDDGAISTLDASMGGRDSGPGSDAGKSDSSMPPVEGGAGDSGVCVPTPELCDGFDNNCDAVVDEGFDFSSNPDHCGTCKNVCKMSTRMCCAGVCQKSC